VKWVIEGVRGERVDCYPEENKGVNQIGTVLRFQWDYVGLIEIGVEIEVETETEVDVVTEVG
jgi:hypothetical protein